MTIETKRTGHKWEYYRQIPARTPQDLTQADSGTIGCLIRTSEDVRLLADDKRIVWCWSACARLAEEEAAG